MSISRNPKQAAAFHFFFCGANACGSLVNLVFFVASPNLFSAIVAIAGLYGSYHGYSNGVHWLEHLTRKDIDMSSS